MPVRAAYADRVFTTAVVSYPDMSHIGPDKDFTPVIEKALELGGFPEDTAFTGLNGGGTVMTGFGHGTVLGAADQVPAVTAPAPAAAIIPSSSSRRRRIP